MYLSTSYIECMRDSKMQLDPTLLALITSVCLTKEFKAFEVRCVQLIQRYWSQGGVHP